jgi:biotin transport system substrate-specific component
VGMHAREGIMSQSSIGSRLLAASFFALVTTACSQVAFHVWFTPVPVTLQVLGVILSGLVLGSRWGAVSQIQYLLMGAMGMPVFAGWMGGPAAFVGPSGGYLPGFVLGAFAAGWVFERLEGRTRASAWLAGIAGMIGIYAPGAAWLGIWLKLIGGQQWGAAAGNVWILGIAPFIGVDLLKVAAASALIAGGRLMQPFRHLIR